jgi:hypothetical protein
MDKGDAEIKIKLRNGIISVIHQEGNFKLAEWISSNGDWDKIWATIDSLVAKNKGVRAGK